jgi:hypothetical protein
MAEPELPQFLPWRTFVKIHPVALAYRPLNKREFAKLTEGIAAVGQLDPVVFFLDDDSLIDGRSRLDAMERIGVKFAAGTGGAPLDAYDPKDDKVSPFVLYERKSGDPYELAKQYNTARRMLTAEDLEDADKEIERLLGADPTRSRPRARSPRSRRRSGATSARGR